MCQSTNLTTVDPGDCSIETLGNLVHIYATWAVLKGEHSVEYLAKAQEYVDIIQERLDELAARI